MIIWVAHDLPKRGVKRIRATVLRPESSCSAAGNTTDVEKVFNDTIYEQANENRK
jgi:hypothetical protein